MAAPIRTLWAQWITAGCGVLYGAGMLANPDQHRAVVFRPAFYIAGPRWWGALFAVLGLANLAVLADAKWSQRPRFGLGVAAGVVTVQAVHIMCWSIAQFAVLATPGMAGKTTVMGPIWSFGLAAVALTSMLRFGTGRTAAGRRYGREGDGDE